MTNTAFVNVLYFRRRNGIKMKRIIKAISISLIFILVLSLVSCSETKQKIMTFEEDGEEIELSSAEFAFALAEIKGQLIERYASYFGDISKDADFWNQEHEGKTLAQTNFDYVEEYCKMLLITDYFCNKYGLNMTNEANEKIDDLIEEIKLHFGGEDLLAIELTKYGIKIQDMRKYYENYERSELLRNYWYGENGTMKIPESDVRAKFFDNYNKVDVMEYSYYTTDETGNNIPFVYNDFTNAEIRDYFDNNFVKVKHILYSTVDNNQEPLTDEEVEQAEKDATDSYNAIKSGEVEFDDKTDETQDGNVEYVFTYNFMVDEFEEASFEMEPDEVRLVETEFGFHIIKKFATTDEDFEGKRDEVKHAMSKARMAEKANKMYEELESGDAEFKEGGDDADYNYMDDIILSKDNMSEDILNKIKELKDGEYYLHKIESAGVEYGYYIFRKVELDDDDLASYYATIEDDLISEAFYNYIKSFYDSVITLQDELDKYDIITTEAFPYFNYEIGTE